MAATSQAPPIHTTLCHMALRLDRGRSRLAPQIYSWAVALNASYSSGVQHGQYATHRLFDQLRDSFHLLAVKPTIRLWPRKMRSSDNFVWNIHEPIRFPKGFAERQHPFRLEMVVTGACHSRSEAPATLARAARAPELTARTRRASNCASRAAVRTSG